MTVKGELDWSCTFSNFIWLFMFSKSENLGWFRIDIDGVHQFVYQFNKVLSSVLTDGSCGSGAWYMMTFLVCFICYGPPFCSFATSLMASFSVNLGLIGDIFVLRVSDGRERFTLVTKECFKPCFGHIYRYWVFWYILFYCLNCSCMALTVASCLASNLASSRFFIAFSDSVSVCMY